MQDVLLSADSMQPATMHYLGMLQDKYGNC